LTKFRIRVRKQLVAATYDEDVMIQEAVTSTNVSISVHTHYVTLVCVLMLYRPTYIYIYLI